MVVKFNHLLPAMPELGMGLPNAYKLLFRTLRPIRASVRSQANGPTGGRFTSAILAWPCWAAHLSVSKNRRSRRLAQSPQVLCFLGKCRHLGKFTIFKCVSIPELL